MHAAGYRIVVFTNEGNVASGLRDVDDIKTLFAELQQKVGAPITFMAATGGDSDPHRKPGTFMWHVFNKRHNEELELDKEVSFYCGDQAGRPASDTRAADSSSCDLLFGRNIGLRFHSPESLFLGEALELPPSS